MVLKLYGFDLSGAALRVAVVLHEKKVPFEMVFVDFAGGEHKSAEHLKRQPFGKVPYIDDDGFILYESRAIGRYLCDKYAAQGTQLMPSGTNTLAIFEQMVSVETVNFNPPTLEVLYQKYFNPMWGSATDEGIVEKNLEKLNATFAIYEQILSKQRYLAGNEITLVDLFHLPGLHLADKINVLPFNDKPNVARWCKEIRSRPSWEAIKDGLKSMEKY